MLKIIKDSYDSDKIKTFFELLYTQPKVNIFLSVFKVFEVAMLSTVIFFFEQQKASHTFRVNDKYTYTQ